jgi:hypothetical protein
LRTRKAGDLIEEAHPAFDARVRIYTLMAKVAGKTLSKLLQGKGRGSHDRPDGVPACKLKFVATVRKVLREPKL